MKEIKLIAMDLDGTLLNSDSQILRSSKEAIAKAKEEGYILVVATGRGYQNARFGAMGDLPEISYYVTANGSIAVNAKTDEIVYRKVFPRETVNTLFEAAEGFNTYMEVYSEGLAIIDNKGINNLMQMGLPKSLCDSVTEGNKLVENIEEEIEKYSSKTGKFNIFFKTEQELDQYMEKIRNVEGINSVALKSIWFGVEITPKGVSKKGALEAICQDLGLCSEQVMAIGDSGNDQEMLQWAGHGVAMGNAEKKIRDMVEIVTADNDHDGVAQAIYNMIEGK